MTDDDTDDSKATIDHWHEREMNIVDDTVSDTCNEAYVIFATCITRLTLQDVYPITKNHFQ